MMPTRQGSFRLFRLAGIDVYLHWSWFLIAVWMTTSGDHRLTALVWSAWGCLALFGIVLLHEFGHALACRSVGGKAELIVLWPLGGVAYVAPPQRPGAMLWSIAAGPLVNVVLLPVTFVLLLLAPQLALSSDALQFVSNLHQINLGFLIFNLLPIYPLDGGQILRSLLWFVFGRARSLLITAIFSLVATAVLAGLAIWAEKKMQLGLNGTWLLVIVFFIVVPNCLRGFKSAQLLQRLAKSPRHEGYACPSCKAAPVAGNFWGCGKCRIAFDAFVTQSVCPQCGTHFALTYCPECGAAHPLSEWAGSNPNPPPTTPPPIPPGA